MFNHRLNIHNFTYFIFLAFLQPALFRQIKLIDNVYVVLKIIAAVIVIFSILKWNKKLSKLSIVMIFFWGTFILSTLINSGDLLKSVKTVLSILPLLLYLDFGLNTNPKYTINCLYKIFTFYFYINFSLQLLLPKGFGPYIPGYINGPDSRINFLGRDNSILFFVVAFIVICFCYYKNIKPLFKHLVLIFIYMIIIWSGTGVVGIIIIMIGILLINKYRNFTRIFSLNILFPMYGLIFYSIIILRTQDYFSYIIVNILHKDITFTGRTLLWDLAIEKISYSPLWGVGIRSDKYLIASSGIGYSSHNLFLQMLLNGGLISLFIFLLGIYYMQKNIGKVKDKKVSAIFGLSIFTYFIGGLTEAVVNDQYIYIILLLGYSIQKLL